MTSIGRPGLRRRARARHRPGRRRAGGVGRGRLRVPDRRGARRPSTRACGASRQLCAKQGLYEVIEGIYQVRGFDLSNMTFVEGDTRRDRDRPADLDGDGRGALALYREHRGDRPVTAVIYTHSHIDHFGGVKGVTDAEWTTAGPVIAPEGFLEHAVAENVYAGPAMRRPATCTARPWRRAGRGVGAGLGLSTVDGARSR